MKRTFLLVSLILFCFVWSAQAQNENPDLYDTIRVVSDKRIQKKYSVYFGIGSSKINSSLYGNGEVLDQIKEDINSIKADKVIPDSLVIVSSSSPDGNTSFNLRLARMRADNTVSQVYRLLPEFRNASLRTDHYEESWDIIIQVLENDPDFPQREQMLSILDTDLSEEMKEASLKKCTEGWAYLIENYIYAFRNSTIYLWLDLKGVVDEYVRIAPLPTLSQLTDTLVFDAPVPAVTRAYHDGPAFTPSHDIIWALRTNLLVPALNAGLEIPIKENWSLGLDYYFPWFWPNQKNKNCFEFLGWSVEGRYWFGRDRQPQDRLRGHSVGLYVGGGYYDFERNYRGMQGQFVSPGLDYTYAMPIGRKKRLNLEFTLAVGYIRSWGTTYNVYGDYGALYPDEGTVIWDYVGPTKAAVTLVVPFYRKEGRK